MLAIARVLYPCMYCQINVHTIAYSFLVFILKSASHCFIVSIVKYDCVLLRAAFQDRVCPVIASVVFLCLCAVLKFFWPVHFVFFVLFRAWIVQVGKIDRSPSRRVRSVVFSSLWHVEVWMCQCDRWCVYISNRGRCSFVQTLGYKYSWSDTADFFHVIVRPFYTGL